MKLFETERLLVRRLQEADLEGFAEMESDERVLRYTGYPAQNREGAEKDLLHCISNYTASSPDKLIYAVIRKEDLAFAGTVALIPYGEKQDPDRPFRHRPALPLSDPQKDTSASATVSDRREDAFCTEIGYRLRHRFWGKGYVSEVVPAFLDFIFRYHPVDEIYGEADVNNTASIRFLSRWMTFEREVFNERLQCTDRQYRLRREDWETRTDD